MLRREPIDFLQISYIYDGQAAAERLLPLAAEKGVAVLVNPNNGWQGGWVGGALGAGHIQRQIVVQGQVIARYGDAPKLDASMVGLNATGGTGPEAPTNSTTVRYASGRNEANVTAVAL